MTTRTCKSVKHDVASAFSRMKNVANHWPKAKLHLLPIAANAAMMRRIPMVRITHIMRPISARRDWEDMKSLQVLMIGRDINRLDSIYAERVGTANGATSRERKR
jgi:hypothetical protein